MKNTILLVFILTFIGTGTSFSKDAQRSIDSLTLRLQNNLHDTERVVTLNVLAWQMMYVNPDTSFTLSSEALKLSKEADWPGGVASSYGRLGAFVSVKGDYDDALKYYWMSIAVYEELLTKSDDAMLHASIASNLTNIATVYIDQGDYPKGLQHNLEALQIVERIAALNPDRLKSKRTIASILGNIGNIYFYEGEYDKTLEYYAKAIKVHYELGNKKYVAAILGNSGSVYKKLDDQPKAIEFYFKSLSIYEELGNKSAMAVNLGNIAGLYSDQGKNEIALEYCYKALKIAEELKDQKSTALHLGNIGILHTAKGEFTRAREKLNEALVISKEIGAKRLLKEQYDYLSVLYDTINKPAEAFAAYKMYILYRDSIDNEENTRAQTRTEMKYEYEKAELVKEQEEKEATRVLSEATSRRDNLQYSIVLICLLMLGAGLLALGKFSVSKRVAEGMIFFSFLIFFEFILVLADPYIDGWSGGAPGIKLLFNAGIAAFIFPLHAFFETRLKGRLVRK